MNEILILGGTGAMGKHLVQLLEDDYLITVTSRQAIKSSGNVTFIQGNAKDPKFITNLLNAKDWHAIIDFMVYDTSTFKSKFEEFLSSSEQYFFISSSRVYAGSNKAITEDSPRLLDTSNDQKFLETDEYALAKARQENYLFNSDKRNWTIIRPYITYDNDRLQLGPFEKEEWLYRALKGRTIIFSEDINSKLTTLTYGKNVANTIKHLIGNPVAMAQAYHPTQNNDNTWQDILDLYINTIEQVLSTKVKVKLVDLEQFHQIKNSPYQIKYDRMYDRCFNNAKVSKLISTEEFLDINSGLKKSLISFLQQAKFKNINWKSEALKDKLSGEVTPLREINGIKQKIKYLLYRFIKN